ncbi:MAG: FAD-dependent oxidoreductase [Deferribacterota bacterium]|nr:FAD-dependent oxidoreductase [Deferribacterota bacterium]
MDLYYGYFRNRLYDNRFKKDLEKPPIQLEYTFIKGTPTVFINWDGFLVFNKDANIIKAFYKFMDVVSSKGCCGRCFPGKFGTFILKELLLDVINGQLEKISFVKELSNTIYYSSKCTNAPTAVYPLIQLLKYFEDEVKKTAGYKNNNVDFIIHQTAPCTAACPAHIKIPEFIEMIKDYEPIESLKIIRENMPLAGVCGRVCPHPCEKNCRRGLIEDPVNIMVLKRFAWDYTYYHNKELNEEINGENKNKRVAIIGAGPAGLSAAYYLLKMGYSVKIYEMLPLLGGMTAVGIPAFRQPRDLLKKEIDDIVRMGAEIEHKRVGIDISFNDVAKSFDATLIAAGAFKSRTMGVEGEDKGYEGLLKSGIDFLREVSLKGTAKIGKKVVVVGGGNTAIDCARTAVRLGAESVHIAYRRSRKEMPAEDYEVNYSIEEGIKLNFLVAPVKILTEKNRVVGLECVKMRLTEPDESGRRRPVPIEGSNFIIECDTIIPAIGQYPNLDFLDEKDGVGVTKWNTIKTEENLFMSSKKGIFAAGDCQFGPDTVVRAVGEGRMAAIQIDRYIRSGAPYLTDEEKLEQLIYKNNLAFNKDEKVEEPKAIDRLEPYMLDPEVRKKTFEEAEKPYTERQAYLESTRCLRCVRMAMLALEQNKK